MYLKNKYSVRIPSALVVLASSPSQVLSQVDSSASPTK